MPTTSLLRKHLLNGSAGEWWQEMQQRHSESLTQPSGVLGMMKQTGYSQWLHGCAFIKIEFISTQGTLPTPMVASSLIQPLCQPTGISIVWTVQLDASTAKNSTTSSLVIILIKTHHNNGIGNSGWRCTTCYSLSHRCKPSPHPSRKASLYCLLQSNVKQYPFPINSVWFCTLQQSQHSRLQGIDSDTYQA